MLNNVVPLKSGVGVVQRDWKWRHSTNRIRDLVRLSLLSLWLYLVSFLRQSKIFVENHNFSFILLHNNPRGKRLWTFSRCSFPTEPDPLSTRWCK